MNLTYDESEKLFILGCTFDERHQAKEAGFSFHPRLKKWTTSSTSVAKGFSAFADGTAKKVLSLLMSDIDCTALLPLTPPGKTLKPYQIETILFCLTREKSYMALSPGLGKTICAIMVAIARGIPVVYICPPFLVGNVKAEFKAWGFDMDMLEVIPDTKLKPELFKKKNPGQIFVDEAHRFSNPTSKRSIAIYELVKSFSFRCFMSGTPLLNRPIELFGVISSEAPEVIDHKSWFDYGRYFCSGRQKFVTPKKKVWDFSGASNLDELGVALKDYMIRFDINELDLPTKTVEYLVAGSAPHIGSLDSIIREKYEKDEDQFLKLTPDSHVMAYRKAIGKEKIKFTVDYVKSVLDDTKDAVILFAYHKDVIATLTTFLCEYHPIVIDGSVDPAKRLALVDKFQMTPSLRLIIANYVAGGIGFNITKANRVIFCEYDWVPAVNEQAEGRAYRFGQRQRVLVQYIVLEDTLDKQVVIRNIEKQNVIKMVGL